MDLIVFPDPGLAGLPFLRELDAGGGQLLCPAEDADAVRALFPGNDVVSFDGGPLTSARPDLAELADRIDRSGEVILVRDAERGYGWDAYVTALGLMGASPVTLLDQNGTTRITPPRRPDMAAARSLLLKVNGGIGNVVQTTPILAAARRHGLDVAACFAFDTGGSLSALFADALPGLVLLTPDESDGFEADIRLNIEMRSHLRDDEYFHSPYRVPMDRSEGLAYLDFFRNVTGLDATPDDAFIGCQDEAIPERLKDRVILAAGSKPHWDPKRYAWFAHLARLIKDPVILCRPTDVQAHEEFGHLESLTLADAEVITDATLPEAAAMLHHARGVIGNDCGLCHMAAATGTPTVVLFGPTSYEKNRPRVSNAHSVSLHLDCQPCQGAKSGPGYLLGADNYACSRGYRCMVGLDAESVLDAADKLFNVPREDWE